MAPLLPFNLETSAGLCGAATQEATWILVRSKRPRSRIFSLGSPLVVEAAVRRCPGRGLLQLLTAHQGECPFGRWWPSPRTPCAGLLLRPRLAEVRRASCTSISTGKQQIARTEKCSGCTLRRSRHRGIPASACQSAKCPKWTISQWRGLVRKNGRRHLRFSGGITLAASSVRSVRFGHSSPGAYALPMYRGAAPFRSKGHPVLPFWGDRPKWGRQCRNGTLSRKGVPFRFATRAAREPCPCLGH
jgi:hypothetical protein